MKILLSLTVNDYNDPQLQPKLQAELENTMIAVQKARQDIDAGKTPHNMDPSMIPEIMALDMNSVSVNLLVGKDGRLALEII